MKKLKLHTSLTASDSSTIAEEIVVLLRRLHPLEVWNPLINCYISRSLQEIPRLISPLEVRKQREKSREDQVSLAVCVQLEALPMQL